jgi:DNA mismatch repair protein MSH6
MESDSEGVDDDEEIFRPQPSRKRRRPAIESEDEFQDDGKDAHMSEDGMTPTFFVVS